MAEREGYEAGGGDKLDQSGDQAHTHIYTAEEPNPALQGNSVFLPKSRIRLFLPALKRYGSEQSDEIISTRSRFFETD